MHYQQQQAGIIVDENFNFLKNVSSMTENDLKNALLANQQEQM